MIFWPFFSPFWGSKNADFCAHSARFLEKYLEFWCFAKTSETGAKSSIRWTQLVILAQDPPYRLNHLHLLNIIFNLHNAGFILQKKAKVKAVGGVLGQKYKLRSSYRTFYTGSWGFRKTSKFQVLFQQSRRTRAKIVVFRTPKWAKKGSKNYINLLLLPQSP